MHVRVKGLRPSPSELIGRWILWKGHVFLAGPFAVSQHLRPRCSAFCAHLHPQGWRCGACSCFLSLLEEGEDTSFLSLCVCAAPSSPRAQNPTTCRQLPSGGTSQIPGSGSTAAPSGPHATLAGSRAHGRQMWTVTGGGNCKMGAVMKPSGSTLTLQHQDCLQSFSTSGPRTTGGPRGDPWWSMRSHAANHI